MKKEGDRQSGIQGLIAGLTRGFVRRRSITEPTVIQTPALRTSLYGIPLSVEGLEPSSFKSTKIDPEAVSIIEANTHRQRFEPQGEGYFYKGRFALEMVGHVGVNTGDYQSDLNLYLDEEDMQPNDLVGQIKEYCRELLLSGEKQVTIVDFGGAQATTLCKVSEQLKPLIKAGRLRLIATNLFSSPTPEDIEYLEVLNNTHRVDLTGYDYFRQQDHLLNALRTKNVEYVQADILELHKLMGDNPIHLMFMFHIFEGFNAGDIGDVLLKIAGTMLDPDKGTLILGHALVPSPMPALQRGDRLTVDLIREGMASLETSGFRKPQYYGRRFHVFQASQAPEFKLAL
ncbi:MAG: hypothetical protein ABSD69_03100 [Candidatus Levyibacteriota bacterium]